MALGEPGPSADLRRGGAPSSPPSSAVLGMIVVPAPGRDHEEMATRASPWPSAAVFLASLPGALFSIAHHGSHAASPHRLGHGASWPSSSTWAPCWVIGFARGEDPLARRRLRRGRRPSGTSVVCRKASPAPSAGRPRRRHRLLCLLFGVACGVASDPRLRGSWARRKGRRIQRARSMLFAESREGPPSSSASS